MRAFQEGKLQQAEDTLQAALSEQPLDSRAVGLMGVILDAEKRYDDAERYYEHALELNPRSASLINNLGNHYLARGDTERARAAYLKVVTIEINHPNANLHLAQISIADKDGRAALRCLGRLRKEEQSSSAAELLRVQGLDLIGKRAEAEDLLRRLEELAHGDARVAFSVGMMYVNWKRYESAERAFTRAREADPGNPEILYNLGLAAMQANHLERAQDAFENALKQRGDDVGSLYNLAYVYLQRKERDKALDTFGRVLAETSDPKMLFASARTLLEAEQYPLARQFLERVLATDSPSTETRLDLAIAISHTSGADAGLAELDKIPAQNRQGDYFLLRAQMLDTVGKFDEAVESLNRGFHSAPTRPDLYFQAALFLIKHRRYRETLDLMRQATQVLPDAPELLLTEAIAFELLQQPDEAQAVLSRIEGRWPEWSQPYLVNGIVLEIRLKSAEAKPLLETAIARGGQDSVAYYYLASAIMHATPEDTNGAQRAIEQAVRLNPGDAYIRSLAGKIAYARKDYPGALEHLNAAVRLWPEMVEARQTLSATYRAMGDKEKSIAELKEIVRIKQEIRTPDQAPPSPVNNILFAVRPPVRPPS